MDKSPFGFMSYARFDDEHDNGRITQLCKRLSGEVRVQTGERFDIFQDTKDIAWGRQWENRIDECVDASALFIPIMTPSFFKSKACRHELERFFVRESTSGRRDLILPIYYVKSLVLENEERRHRDRLATLISTRNYCDWRELRAGPLDSPESRIMLVRMAKQIAAVLEGRHPEPYRPPGLTSTAPYAVDAAPGRSAHATSTPANQRIIVDAFHRGNFETVLNALRAAQAGDQILVRLT